MITRLVDVPDKILVPVAAFCSTGFVEVDGWRIGWPNAKGSIHINQGSILFEPPIKASSRLISVSISEGKVQPNGKDIFLDINASPIDVKLT